MVATVRIVTIVAARTEWWRPGGCDQVRSLSDGQQQGGQLIFKLASLGRRC